MPFLTGLVCHLVQYNPLEVEEPGGGEKYPICLAEGMFSVVWVVTTGQDDKVDREWPDLMVLFPPLTSLSSPGRKNDKLASSSPLVWSQHPAGGRHAALPLPLALTRCQTVSVNFSNCTDNNQTSPSSARPGPSLLLCCNLCNIYVLRNEQIQPDTDA